MQLTQKEAVRLAKETLGDVPVTQLAAYIQETNGLKIQPAIVSVLLCSSKEREALDRTGQAIREEVERWKAQNPEEARKMAATLKRREAAARRKAAKENLLVSGMAASCADLTLAVSSESVKEGQEAVEPGLPEVGTSSGGASASLPTL